MGVRGQHYAERYSSLVQTENGAAMVNITVATNELT
jgi:hypothetical protein